MANVLLVGVVHFLVSRSKNHTFCTASLIDPKSAGTKALGTTSRPSRHLISFAVDGAGHHPQRHFASSLVLIRSDNFDSQTYSAVDDGRRRFNGHLAGRTLSR
jgi:hypothetical protein